MATVLETIDEAPMAPRSEDRTSSATSELLRSEVRPNGSSSPTSTAAAPRPVDGPPPAPAPHGRAGDARRDIDVDRRRAPAPRADAAVDGSDERPSSRTHPNGSRTRRTKGGRTTPRPASPAAGRGISSAVALLLGAGVLVGSTMTANALAPGRLTLPDRVATLLGQPNGSTIDAQGAAAPIGAASKPRVATTAAGRVDGITATSPATTTTPATTAAGAAASTSIAATPAASSGPQPTAGNPTSTTSAGTAAAPASAATTAAARPAVLDAAPQATLPGGQDWPVATRAADGTLVLTGVVPSEIASERLAASFGWYQGPKTNRLTVDPTAVAVRYVPVRLGGEPLVLPLGQGALTDNEQHVLPLWAKFLVQNPSAHVLIGVQLPTPATPELAAAASDHLAVVQADLLATGASASQVTGRLVPADATADPVVQIAVAVDAAG